MPSCERYELILHAFRQGLTLDEIHELTGDRRASSWPSSPTSSSSKTRRGAAGRALGAEPPAPPQALRLLRPAPRRAHRHAASARSAPLRLEHGVVPVYKAVDTCAAEFEAETPYFYSTYEDENEALPGERERVVILGSGPNRIGQGIEFDYCCVHAAMTVREHGYEAVMVNCNPETVSHRLRHLRPALLRAAHLRGRRQHRRQRAAQGRDRAVRRPDAAAASPTSSRPAGIPILGTPQEAIDLAEDRGRFGTLLDELGIRCPDLRRGARPRRGARDRPSASATRCLVRPSYVLGGRAMEIVYGERRARPLHRHRRERVSPDHPVLIDKFLEDAIEVDVDALCDGDDVYIGGIMQHVEEAGVHSGDSSCVLPVDLARRGHARAGAPPDARAGPGARRARAS